MFNKKMLVLSALIASMVIPTVYADLTVDVNYQNLNIIYTPTSATAGAFAVQDTGSSQFAAYLNSNGTAIDSALMQNTNNPLTDFQLQFLTSAFSNPVGADNISMLADVTLTDSDHNTLANPSMKAKFQNVGFAGDADGISYSLATKTLSISGIIWTPAGNTSILLNPASGTWNYLGTSQDAILGNGSDGIANQFSIPSPLRDNYDSGTLAILKLTLNKYNDGSAITANSADDLFKDAFSHGGFNVTLGQLQVDVVPAPAAMLLGMIGLSFVGWVKRRLA